MISKKSRGSRAVWSFSNAGMWPRSATPPRFCRRRLAMMPRSERASILTMQVGTRDETYGLTELMHPAGTIWLAGPHGAEGTRLRIVVKATDVTLSTAPPQGLSVQGALRGRLGEIESLGPLAIAHVALDGDGTLLAMTTRRALDKLGLITGEPIFALVKTAALDERLIGGA